MISRDDLYAVKRPLEANKALFAYVGTPQSQKKPRGGRGETHVRQRARGPL